MTRPLVLEIGAIRIDAVGTPEDAVRIEQVLRDGLDQLAERLKSTAFSRDPQGLAVAIGALEIDSLTAEDWLGARGAARVAELLYDSISAGRSG